MRIWDIPPENLCDRHLLGEHAELHAVWNILTKKKKGYSAHPETRRWAGKLKALYLRHDDETAEMEKRGFRHSSVLDKELAKGKGKQDTFIDDLSAQKRLLKEKGCECLK